MFKILMPDSHYFSVLQCQYSTLLFVKKVFLVVLHTLQDPQSTIVIVKMQVPDSVTSHEILLI